MAYSSACKLRVTAGSKTHEPSKFACYSSPAGAPAPPPLSTPMKQTDRQTCSLHQLTWELLARAWSSSADWQMVRRWSITAARTGENALRHNDDDDDDDDEWSLTSRWTHRFGNHSLHVINCTAADNQPQKQWRKREHKNTKNKI